MINRGLFNSICLPCPARSKQWLSWLSCSVCECGLSDAISVSRYLHNVLQTKWLTFDAYDCCNWHPLYPGTHSNDDNDGHLFRGRIHPPDVWAWSALSSVPRASDHLTTHRCFVSRAHLLVRACLALGTSGWGKGQTWKVLLESSPKCGNMRASCRH